MVVKKTAFLCVQFNLTLLFCISLVSSRIFHFVTRDYFRYRHESSDETDSDQEEEEERDDFVAGGIYSPQTQTNEDAHGIKLAIATAVGIKQYAMKSDCIQLTETNTK